jgi:transposase
MRGEIMKPVIGIDVAKGASVIQAFLKRNVPYGKPEKILHTPRGFRHLRDRLGELEMRGREKPSIILEPTGHYHRVLVWYLQRERYEVILVNPLQAQRARRTGLRKVKTDASDAWHLGDLYYQEADWMAHPLRDECLVDLQYLTRQHEFVTSIYVQSKLNMRALVDQVFPSYSDVFKDFFSKTSLNLLEHCLSPEGIQERTDKQWVGIITESTKASRSVTWMNKKVQLLREATVQNPVTKVTYGLEKALYSMIVMIREFQKELN